MSADEQPARAARAPRATLAQMLGCTSPIQQAGFGSSLNVELVSAVASAGGIGMVGGALATPRELASALAAIGEHAHGAVGVNFVEPFFDRHAHAELLDIAARHADLVEFFYGEPDSALVQRIHAGGALAGWQVGSLPEALAAQDAGVDVIVVQGVEAGGHVRGTQALLPLLSQTLAAVRTPVIAAGGICSGRALAAVLAAGACAARLGTRFVASVESDFHPLYKDALVRAQAGDTVHTQRFSELWPHAPHRVLASAIAAAEQLDAEFVGEMSVGAKRERIPRFAGFAPVADTTGEIDAMALFAGEAVGEIDEILPAAEIVMSLTREAELLLRSPPWPGSDGSTDQLG